MTFLHFSVIIFLSKALSYDITVSLILKEVLKCPRIQTKNSTSFIKR